MNEIGGISTQAGGLPASTTKAAKGMGKEDFLTMLIAQLKNQDPLNPLNGSDFAVQLAQFSSLEQLTNMNTQLETLGTSLASLTNAQLVNVIGSEASAKGDTLTVDGAATTVAYSLSGDARKVTITIYDDQGVPVKTMDAGSQKAGLNSLTWDTAGVKQGTYTFTVSALDGSGNAMPASTMLTGKVRGVSFKDGVPYLSINGRDVSYKDVVSVTKPVL
jgi:flagellar basal-body rod modification protein FlgD